MNELGVVTEIHTMSMWDGRRSWRDHPTPFLDFTIDGRSLRDLFNGSDSITLFAADEFDSAFRAESRERLLGTLSVPPDLSPRFYKNGLERWLGLKGAPIAPFGTAFEDGRVGLLFCRCGDLDCGTLSTAIEIHDESVVWRDIGWQTTYEHFDGEVLADARRTFSLCRSAYETVVRSLPVSD